MSTTRNAALLGAAALASALLVQPTVATAAGNTSVTVEIAQGDLLIDAAESLSLLLASSTWSGIVAFVEVSDERGVNGGWTVSASLTADGANPAVVASSNFTYTNDSTPTSSTAVTSLDSSSGTLGSALEVQEASCDGYCSVEWSPSLSVGDQHFTHSGDYEFTLLHSVTPTA
jgi:hypothetical protein